MKRKLVVALMGVAALAALSWGLVTAGGSTDSADSVVTYEVSITNLTRGQPLSPIFMATHMKGAGPLYALGQPASADLAALAEDADASGLLGAWNPATNELVSEAQFVKSEIGPILPGKTVTAHDHGPGQGAVSLPGKHDGEHQRWLYRREQR